MKKAIKLMAAVAAFVFAFAAEAATQKIGDYTWTHRAYDEDMVVICDKDRSKGSSVSPLREYAVSDPSILEDSEDTITGNEERADAEVYFYRMSSLSSDRNMPGCYMTFTDQEGVRLPKGSRIQHSSGVPCKVYRNGEEIGSLLTDSVRNAFTDYDVIPGETYTYEIIGQNGSYSATTGAKNITCFFLYGIELGAQMVVFDADDSGRKIVTYSLYKQTGDGKTPISKGISCTCDDDWIHVDIETGVISIWVEQNDADTARTGFVTLEYTGFKWQIKVVQRGSATLTIDNGKLISVSLNDATRVIIPDSVTEIAFAAFSGCGAMTSVTISDGVTAIGRQAFYACNSLTSVMIPNSVTSIGDGAFSNCSSLTSVTLPAKFKDNLDASVFDGCPAGLVITYYGNDAYTVTYRKYDGSGETASEDFECGKTYTLAWLGSELGWSRPGYEFVGWVPWNPDTKPRLCKYVNGQPVKDLAKAGETVNLWAGWKSSSSYRVCFHRCAGPDDLEKMNQVILRNKEDNLAWMDSMIGWKREGYTFLGWDESDKASAVKYANGAKVQNLAMDGGTKHLYAVWRAKDDHKYPYTVKYYKYDGSGETRTQSFKAGAVQSLLWMNSQLGWSRPGYEFVGWVPWNPDTKPRLCKYANGQKVVDLASKSGEVVSLYPAWKSSSSYRVCFNRNDGTGVNMNQVILRNKEDTLAWMDSQIGWKRDGYVFKGWAESASGAVKYANGAKVKNLAMDGGTKHLYAVWRVADGTDSI